MRQEAPKHPETIFLRSETVGLKVVEGAKALISAFFPRAAIKTGLPGQIYRPDRVKDQVSIRVEEENGSFTAVWRKYGAEKAQESQVSEKAGEFEEDGQTLENEEDTGDGKGLLRAWERPEGRESLEAILSESEVEVILSQPRPGREDPVSILVKHVLLRLLSEVTGEELPWGILTGIRPTKLVHRLQSMGLSVPSQGAALENLYRIRPDKIKLLQEVALVQEPYLQVLRKHPERVSIYIGIPFCPSRCSYCSFPAYLAGKGREAIAPYLAALKQEIQAVGELMRANGLEGDTLYLGGGTPTTLNAEELRELLVYVKGIMPLSSGLELTVEAGRPDTLSLELLEALGDLGVNRLSINPQTMQEQTLRRIGRAHSPQSVVEMYRLARNIKDWIINMDLILGLPGEGLSEFESTLEHIERLRPDNLTVHALALKRGAREREMGHASVEPPVAERMQRLAQEATRTWGMRPYYLYRQKRIAGNLENIGYAQPGRESRYNIAIMEEQQHILGLGAGAASKILNPSGQGLTNLQHVADLKSYEAHWQLLHARRLVSLSGR